MPSKWIRCETKAALTDISFLDVFSERLHCGETDKRVESVGKLSERELPTFCRRGVGGV